MREQNIRVIRDARNDIFQVLRTKNCQPSFRTEGKVKTHSVLQRLRECGPTEHHLKST